MQNSHAETDDQLHPLREVRGVGVAVPGGQGSQGAVRRTGRSVRGPGLRRAARQAGGK